MPTMMRVMISFVIMALCLPIMATAQFVPQKKVLGKPIPFPRALMAADGVTSGSPPCDPTFCETCSFMCGGFPYDFCVKTEEKGRRGCATNPFCEVCAVVCPERDGECTVGCPTGDLTCPSPMTDATEPISPTTPTTGGARTGTTSVDPMTTTSGSETSEPNSLSSSATSVDPNSGGPTDSTTSSSATTESSSLTSPTAVGTSSTATSTDPTTTRVGSGTPSTTSGPAATSIVSDSTETSSLASSTSTGDLITKTTTLDPTSTATVSELSETSSSISSATPRDASSTAADTSATTSTASELTKSSSSTSSVLDDRGSTAVDPSSTTTVVSESTEINSSTSLAPGDASSTAVDHTASTGAVSESTEIVSSTSSPPGDASSTVTAVDPSSTIGTGVSESTETGSLTSNTVDPQATSTLPETTSSITPTSVTPENDDLAGLCQRTPSLQYLACPTCNDNSSTIESTEELRRDIAFAASNCTARGDSFCRTDVSIFDLDCADETPIEIPSGLCLFVKGRQGLAEEESIRENCDFRIRDGAALVLYATEFLGSVEAENSEQIAVGLNNQDMILWRCLLGWTTRDSTDACFQAISDFDLELLNYTVAESLCIENEGSSPAILDGSDDDLVATLLDDDDAFLGQDEDGNCRIMQASGGITTMACDAASAPQIVCSLPKRKFPFNPISIVTTMNYVGTLTESWHLDYSPPSFSTDDLEKFNELKALGFYDFALDQLDPATTMKLFVQDFETPLATFLRNIEEGNVYITITTDQPLPLLDVAVDSMPGEVEVQQEDTISTVPAANDFGVLPTMVFIHSNDQEVCIKTLSLSVGSVVVVDISIAALAFCGRTPDFEYDSTRECVILRGDRGNRDLVLDFDSIGCDQLSLARTPDFMQSMVFMVDGSVDGLLFANHETETEMVESGILDDLFRFPRFVRVSLDGDTFPDPAACISSMRVEAYGDTLGVWNAATTFKCLESCPLFASNSSLCFGSVASGGGIPNGGGLSSVVVDLMATGCDALIKVDVGNRSGVEACSSTLSLDDPSQLETLQQWLDDRAAEDWRQVVIDIVNPDEPTTTPDPGTASTTAATTTTTSTNATAFSWTSLSITVPSNLHVILRSFNAEASGTKEQVVLENPILRVDNGGTLELVALVLSGFGTSIRNAGKLVVEECEMFLDDAPGLENEGTAEISVTKIYGTNSTIDNTGMLTLKSVAIADGERVSNSGTLVFERVEVGRDDFGIDGTGSLNLRDNDLELSFTENDENYCTTDDATLTNTPLWPVSNLEECKALCLVDDRCTALWFDGYSSAFDGTSSGDAYCGLCRGVPGTTGCGFNCTIEVSVIMEMKRLVAFTYIGENFCSPLRPIQTPRIQATTLGECRGWCSSLSNCKLLSFHELASPPCLMFSQVTTVPCSNSTEPRRRSYIPAEHDDDDFAELPTGVCLQRSDSALEIVFSDDQSPSSTIHRSDLMLPSSVSDCSAFCGSYSPCASFEFDTLSSSCKFFPWSSKFHPSYSIDPGCSATTRTFFSLADSTFPISGYFDDDLLEFPCSLDVSNAAASLVAGGLDSCKAACNKDPLCVAFTVGFISVQNCFLWYAEFLNGLGNDMLCDQTEARTFLIHSRQDYAANVSQLPDLFCEDRDDGVDVVGENQFDHIPGAVTLDMCKAVCHQTVGCESLRFDSFAPPGEGCRIGCSPSFGQAATHGRVALSVVQPSISYQEVLARRMGKRIVIPNNSIGSGEQKAAGCRRLCDITDDCIAYQTEEYSGSVENACYMLSDVEFVPFVQIESNQEPPANQAEYCDGSNGECETVFIAYSGKRRKDFLQGPSSTVFLDTGRASLDGANSTKRCLDSCILSSDRCEAVSVEWSNGGRCVHYNSSLYESPDGRVTGDRSVFFRYSSYVYIASYNGTSYFGDEDLGTEYENVTQSACETICSFTPQCGAVEYDTLFNTCKLFGGRWATSNKTEEDSSLVLRKTEVHPFVQAQGWQNIDICDSSDLILLSQQSNLAACQALCLANVECGTIRYSSELNDCYLYDSETFFEPPYCLEPSPHPVYVSYARYVVHDRLRKYTTLTPSRLGTARLCPVNATPSDIRVDIPSELACAALCSRSETSCGAYQFDDVSQTCSLLDYVDALVPCLGGSDVRISYEPSSFYEADGLCIRDYGRANPRTHIGNELECAALCDAFTRCEGFRTYPSAEQNATTCELFPIFGTVLSTYPCEQGTINSTFLYTSSANYTTLGSSFCVSSDLEIASLALVEGEACKRLCDLTEACRAVEHTVEAGECLLFRTSAYEPCTDSSRVLSISSREIEESFYETTMAALENMCMVFRNDTVANDVSECSTEEPCSLSQRCASTGIADQCREDLSCQSPTDGSHFGVATTEDDFFCLPTEQLLLPIENCSQACLDDAGCAAVSWYDDNCLLLSEVDLQQLEPSTDCSLIAATALEVHIKYRKNPYRVLDGACFTEPLSSSGVGPFEGMNLVDCMTACTSYPLCQHFELSDWNVCSLFAAQIGGVTDFTCAKDNVTAYWKSISFRSTTEYFGIPERYIARAQSVPESECAVVCQSFDHCNAYTIDGEWCVLSTYERTPAFQMQNLWDDLVCLNMNFGGSRPITCPSEPIPETSSRMVSSCSDATSSSFQYYYGDRTIRNFDNSSQCVARLPDPVRGYVTGPIDWVDCNDTSHFIGRTWLINGTTIASDPQFGSVFQMTYLRCSRRVMAFSNARIAGDTTFQLASQWRGYESGTLPTEMHLKPSAGSFEISDPLLKFQIWYWSQDGYESRYMLSRLELLYEGIDILNSFFTRSEDTVRKVSTTLDAVRGYSDPAEGTIGDLSEFADGVEPVPFPLERLAYVGPVVKTIRLKSITSQFKKGTDAGKDAIAPVSDTLSIAEGIVQSFQDLVDPLKVVLEGLPELLDLSGNMIVRLLGLAFLEVNDELQASLTTVVRSISASIDFFELVLKRLTGSLSRISSFGTQVDSKLVSPFKKLNKGFGPINKVVDAMGFLVTIFEYKIPLKNPVGLKKGGGIKWKKKDLGLEELSDFMKKIEKWVKKIPAVKFVMGIVEKVMKGELGKLFPKFELPLPGTSFLDDGLEVFATLQETINDVFEEIESKLRNATAIEADWLNGFAETIDGDALSQFIDDNVPSDFLDLTTPDVDLNCSSTSCISDVFGRVDFNLPTDVDTSNLADDVRDLTETVEDAFSNITDELVDKMGGLIDGISCLRYENVSFEGLGGIARAVGLVDIETADLVLREAVPAVDFCSEYRTPDNATDEVVSLLSDTFDDLDLPGRLEQRRRLQRSGNISIVFTATQPLAPFTGCIPRLEAKITNSNWWRRDPTRLDAFVQSSRVRKIVQTFLNVSCTRDEPCGANIRLGTAEVLAASFKFNIDGLGVSIGVRDQAQLLIQLLGSWWANVNSLVKKGETELEKGVGIWTICTTWIPSNPACMTFLNEFKRLNDTIALPDTIRDAVVSRTTWDLLTFEQKRDAINFVNGFGVIKSGYSNAFDNAMNTNAIGDEIYDNRDRFRDVWNECLKKARDKIFFQLRVAENPPTPQYPAENVRGFSGFQVFLAPTGTERGFVFRKDFYWPLPTDRNNIGNYALMNPKSLGAGSFAISTHAGTSSSIFSFGTDFTNVSVKIGGDDIY